MYVLDTNVVSELMKEKPDPTVLETLVALPEDAQFTTAMSEAEIFGGVARLPHGRRRQSLHDAASRLFDEDFEGRVLPFDSASARVYSQVVAERRNAGRSVEGFDLLNAAIARCHGAVVVTRDRNGFADTGVETLDPWSRRLH